MGYAAYVGDRPVGHWMINVDTAQDVQAAEGPFTMPVWSPDGSKLAFDGGRGEYGRGPSCGIWMIETKELQKLRGTVEGCQSGPGRRPPHHPGTARLRETAFVARPGAAGHHATRWAAGHGTAERTCRNFQARSRPIASSAENPPGEVRRQRFFLWGDTKVPGTVVMGSLCDQWFLALVRPCYRASANAYKLLPVRT